MNKTFQIIIPTQMSQIEFEKTLAYQCICSLCNSASLQDSEMICYYKVYYNNTVGLSELYQSVLDETTADYVIFMHDDLEIHDHFLFKKLVKAHEKFDIVGLAGAKSQDYTTASPLVWHLSLQRSHDARGIVGHYLYDQSGGSSEMYVNSIYFGPSPAQVVVIDGLFMSFKMDKPLPQLFDKTFTFHHYDMAMCANAVRNNLTIGVYPIYCVHHGLGEFENDKTWEKHSKEFKIKYNNYKMNI